MSSGPSNTQRQHWPDVSVAGAKNEHIPFQVVLSAPLPDKLDAPLSGFWVEAGDLRSEAGRIPSQNAKLYFEHSILCYGKSGPVDETGFWPDALAPLTEPFGMAVDFRQAIRNCAVWVDVVTPPDIPAGNYSGVQLGISARSLLITRTHRPKS